MPQEAPLAPRESFSKKKKWDEKNMTSAVRIRICIRKRKKGPNKNLQEMRRGGQKCRAKTFIGTSKCAGSTQFVEFCRLVQFWVKTDILKANCDHFVPRSFLVRRNASGLKVWGFGTHGCRGTGTWGSQSFGTWGGSAMNDRAPPPFAAEHGARRAPIPVWAIHVYQWR